MGLGGPPRESTTALASTMVDLHAGERPSSSHHENQFREELTPTWQDWWRLAIIVGLVAFLLAILLWLP